jgi:hypothetical protein
MGFNLPGLGKSNEGRPELTNAILSGTTEVSGKILVNETTTPEDLSSGVRTLPKVFIKEVDCSAGGTAQTATLFTPPAGSTILEVETFCTQAFNGNATKTFEVGVNGNTDKYIDPVDCVVTLAGIMWLQGGTNNDQKKPEAIGTAVALIATWTNTAAATAGKMRVKVIYA